jgi:hypothetical protein
MSNDPVARARAMLSSRASSVNPGTSSTLVARARAAIEAPPPMPRVERVKIPLTCSARGETYIVIAERHGNELRFVGHELPQPGNGGAFRMPGRLSGEYRIMTNGWTCPLCRNGGGVWLCDCAAMSGAMHCSGTLGGRYRCACGRSEEREFVTIAQAEVRGTSVAATPEQNRSGQQRGQSQLKQVTYDR